ncbi:MAG: hypothetical protein AB1705_21490 [Verrucomicrobiota bacterium]
METENTYRVYVLQNTLGTFYIGVTDEERSNTMQAFRGGRAVAVLGGWRGKVSQLACQKPESSKTNSNAKRVVLGSTTGPGWPKGQAHNPAGRDPRFKSWPATNFRPAGKIRQVFVLGFTLDGRFAVAVPGGWRGKATPFLRRFLLHSLHSLHSLWR